MNGLLYLKLAVGGMRKNQRIYLPYMLACAGMVMMQYLLVYLTTSPAVASLFGGDSVCMVLDLGSFVLAFFSAIFLFYTHSFLMRRRRREFGLYNVLGMGKKELGVILFWETLLLWLGCTLIGLGLGLAFSKLGELLLMALTGGPAGYALRLSAEGLLRTPCIFGAIFLCIFLNALRQVRFSTATALLGSEARGEKPPRANWVFGLLGAALLGAGYYLAVTIKDPLSALTVFFAAVLLVIGGTYLLMVFGSVLLCRVLQKKKRYYYRADHFVFLSSMAFRMKRNGAGLASICILSTMVLVMVSTTSSLYLGEEDMLNSRYPRELNVSVRFEDPRALGDAPDASLPALREELLAALAQKGVTPQNVMEYSTSSFAGVLQDGEILVDPRRDMAAADILPNLFTFDFVPLADYNRITGEARTLSPGEALIYVSRGDLDVDALRFEHGETLRIAERLSEFPAAVGVAMVDVVSHVFVVVPDLAQALGDLTGLAIYTGDPLVQNIWYYDFDTGLPPEEQQALARALSAAWQRPAEEAQSLGYSFDCEDRESNRADLYALYGGLFYLGALLSLVFLCAAVLIIYYKQLSEGYEDEARFDIMRKVGITDQEIKKSINSQLLTVFFAPLLLAGCHLAFAFPMLEELMFLFNLRNIPLFALVTAGSLCAFAALYVLCYRFTAHTYYRIVKSASEE